MIRPVAVPLQVALVGFAFMERLQRACLWLGDDCWARAGADKARMAIAKEINCFLKPDAFLLQVLSPDVLLVVVLFIVFGFNRFLSTKKG